MEIKDELLKAKVLDNKVLMWNSICNTISTDYLKRKKDIFRYHKGHPNCILHTCTLRKTLKGVFHQHWGLNHSRGWGYFKRHGTQRK